MLCKEKETVAGTRTNLLSLPATNEEFLVLLDVKRRTFWSERAERCAIVTIMTGDFLELV